MLQYNNGEILAYKSNKYRLFKIIGHNIKYLIKFTDIVLGVCDYYMISSIDNFKFTYNNPVIEDFKFERLSKNLSRYLLYKQNDDGIDIIMNSTYSYSLEVSDIGSFGKTIDFNCGVYEEDGTEEEFTANYNVVDYNTEDVTIYPFIQNNKVLSSLRTNSIVNICNISKNLVRNVRLAINLNFYTGIFILDINIKTDNDGNPLVLAICDNHTLKGSYIKLFYVVENNICRLYIKNTTDYNTISVIYSDINKQKLELIEDSVSEDNEVNIYYKFDFIQDSYPDSYVDQFIDYNKSCICIVRNGKKFNSLGELYDIKHSGTFLEKPTSEQGIRVGFVYFCTDRQTTEGSTNGIMIYHKGDNVWVDALGRIVS